MDANISEANKRLTATCEAPTNPGRSADTYTEPVPEG
jgi:hypothetical protein